MRIKLEIESPDQATNNSWKMLGHLADEVQKVTWQEISGRVVTVEIVRAS